MPQTLRAATVAALALALACPAARADVREDEPVVIRGSQAIGLRHAGVLRIHVFRYDEAGASFVPVTFQLDERVATTFNPGSPLEFVETIYDIFGEDDGDFDEDDEIVFRFGDAGDRAPGDAAWPSGAEPLRWEIEIVDPRPAAPTPSRFVYLHVGDALPHADASYVDWDLSPSGAMRSDVLELGWEDRWILDQIRVLAPCGTGEDLVDRVKGRARTHLGMLEDEESWNLNSTFLGGLVGPVRSIRYVRGATSGVNTIHHDVLYRNRWERIVNLRVHTIAEVRTYLDLRPVPGTRWYAPTVPAEGIEVDGAPDDVPSTASAWTVFSGPAGGLAIAWDVSPASKFGGRATEYVDDAGHDDALAGNPGYGDEDDSAFGAHGVRVTDLADTNTEALQFRMRAWGLCAGAGDGATGLSFRDSLDQPLTVVVRPQSEGASPIRGLAVSRSGVDAVLSWEPVAGAISYRVYRTIDPGSAPSTWTPRGETVTPTFRDVGAAAGPTAWAWSVVAIDASGTEGPW